jgi:hypothetical protein
MEMSSFHNISEAERIQQQADMKKFDKSALETAIKYREEGLAVHWLRPMTKIPATLGWNDVPVASADDLRASHKYASNVGFRPGKFSFISPKNIGVIDIDVKHADFADEACANADELLEGKFNPTVITGSVVGRHQYIFVIPGSIPDKAATTLCHSDVGVKDGKIVPLGTEGSKPAWTIEFLYTGKNCVMPPSIHPNTLQPYKWANGQDMGTIIDMPQSMVAQLNGKTSASDWPTPEVIKFDLLPVAKFDAALLPDVLRDFVYDIADRAQCPVDFVAVVVVQTLCTVIGNACAVRPKQHDDWSESCNLWAAIVGRPGQLKTPAKNGGSEPLRWLENLAQEAHKSEMVFFERTKVDRELDIQQLKNIKSRTSQQQQELSDMLSNPPVEPTLRRYRTSDATVEKLGSLLNENPRGLLVDRDELIGLLAQFAKAGHETDRSFYLEGWNGNGRFIVDRIGRGTTIVEHLTLLVFGSIQPAKLQRYLHDSMYGLGNDGLLQRFQLFVYPDEVQAAGMVDRSPNHDARDVVVDLATKLSITDFVSLGATVEDRRPTPYFRFADDAQVIFNDWYVGLGHKVAAEEMAIVAEHLGKYRKLVPALSLVFHLVDLITGVTPINPPIVTTVAPVPLVDSQEAISTPAELSVAIAATVPVTTTTPVATPITLAALERALAWSVYLESHARRIYHMAVDIREDAVKSLSGKLAKGELQDGFTERDVYKRQWSNLSNPELVEAAFSELEQAGWIRRLPREKGGAGRPSVKYEINPSVTGNKV